MSIDAARAFNRACPAGNLVEATMRDGTTRTGKTLGTAIVWAEYALIELQGWPSYWTVEYGEACNPNWCCSLTKTA